MGGAVSKDTISVRDETLTETFQSFMSVNNINSDQTITSTQTNEVEYGDITGGCSLSVKNISSGTQVFDGSFSASQLTEMEEDVTKDLTGSFKQTAEAISDAGGSIGWSENKTEIENSIKKVTEQFFESNNFVTTVQKVVSTQSNKVKFGNITCPKKSSGGQIEVTNEFLSEQISKTLVENLNELISKDTFLSKMQLEFEQTAKTENKGLFGSFDNFVNKFADMVGGIVTAYAIMISICCIIIGFILYSIFKSPAGQNAIRKGVNKI